MPFFLSPHVKIHVYRYRDMIRLFSVFCKLNFIKLNAKQLFNEAVSRASMHRFPCPFCGALHPDWAYFESYERHLVAFEQGACADHTVSVTRYQCGSCGHTHALLPEIAIPYSPYSILFILHVLRDRFVSGLAIDAICRKYLISPHTFYRWMQLFLAHKQQWLGILDDMAISPRAFLDGIPSSGSPGFLCQFWARCHVSFLQAGSHGETVHASIWFRPPPCLS